MGKFNKIGRRSATGRGPIRAERTPTGRTHEGARGYARDAKSELFLLGVSNLVGGDTFYERAHDRDDRYARLVGEVALADPQWTLDFITWLRGSANLRSAAMVAAVEAVKARLDADIGASPVANRAMIAAALQRADEPGELLAYWTQRYGRALAQPVKRGVADAVGRLYDQFALLKYDTAGKPYRFADVIDLTHPRPVAPWQGDLFRVALERRHQRERLSFGDALPMLVTNRELRHAAATAPHLLLDPDRLRAAGFTWEDALSLAGSTVDKGRLWSALIPSMGYMALLRNLRNFDEAGVADEVAQRLAERLADPNRVATSRQLPYRFLAAQESVRSQRWGHALDRALAASVANVPALRGRSLVLVDTSASMTSGRLSRGSTMTPAKVAAVFGVTLALRNRANGVGSADLVGFADGVFTHEVPRGASVLREVQRFIARTGEVGHGTRIAEAIRAAYRGHDRVFVISDMQTMTEGTGNALPATVPLYGFTVGGYARTPYRSGSPNRHEFGGLTDATFRMVNLIEAGRTAAWPWL